MQCSEWVKPGRQATTKARGEEEGMLQHLPKRHGSNSTAQNPPLQQQGQQEVLEQHQAACLRVKTSTKVKLLNFC